LAEQLCSDNNINEEAFKFLNFMEEREAVAIKLLSCSGMKLFYSFRISSIGNLAVNLESTCVLCGKSEDDEDIHQNKWVLYYCICVWGLMVQAYISVES